MDVTNESGCVSVAILLGQSVIISLWFLRLGWFRCFLEEEVLRGWELWRQEKPLVCWPSGLPEPWGAGWAMWAEARHSGLECQNRASPGPQGLLCRLRPLKSASPGTPLLSTLSVLFCRGMPSVINNSDILSTDISSKNTYRCPKSTWKGARHC